jgi:hypothetical protein
MSSPLIDKHSTRTKSILLLYNLLLRARGANEQLQFVSRESYTMQRTFVNLKSKLPCKSDLSLNRSARLAGVGWRSSKCSRFKAHASADYRLIDSQEFDATITGAMDVPDQGDGPTSTVIMMN